MNDYTIVEKYQQGKKNSPIAIRPYFDGAKENMGLQNYGMALHDGVWHEESLACLELNGIKRYVTGLNEFAPEVKMLQGADKEEKIKEIREVVTQLEAELASNVIDPEDKDFWNKVELLKPNNFDFWNKISIRCGNDPVYLDPSSDPYDLIRIYAIFAGGFSIVAKSYKQAKTSNKEFRFYLDTMEESVSTRTEYTKLRNKALAELQNLYDTDTTKLMYVAKVLDIDSVQYVKSTPNDILYENMDMYINGELFETNMERSAKSFTEAAKSSMEDLKLRALVKDAIYYRYLSTKGNGWIEPLNGGIKLGKSPSEVVAALKKPDNEEILLSLLEKVEAYWNT
jgi:hypothetical protein